MQTWGSTPKCLRRRVCFWGLVAFGFLGMGPVTIAVDSYVRPDKRAIRV